VNLRPARPGLAAYTADGKLLGTIGESLGSYFSVKPDDPNQRKYWLSLSRIASPDTAESVTLDFEFEELEDKKVGSPVD
jgi:hypothetical protein